MRNDGIGQGGRERPILSRIRSLRLRATAQCALVLAVVVPTSTPLLIAQDSLYIHDHYRKEELSIPMRDGVRLFTSIYFPVDTTLIYPIILLRTPYGVGPYGAEAIRSRMAPSMLEARAGYIFAYQDVRGCYRSEGDFVNVRPYREHKRDAHDVDESSDTFDTIDWLIHHVPHNNGRVAITGISYPGFYAVMGMIDAHPALVAASPQAPIADWFIGDDDHHHGALFLAEAFGFYINFGRPRNGLTTRHGASFNYGTADGYAFFLQMGPLSNANALYMKDSIAFWNETMLHGTYDAFWQQRNTLPHLKNIRPSVMVVGGWFDKEDLYGTLNTYKAIREKSPGTSCVLVMGPWSHGEWDADDGDHLGPIPFGAKTALWYRNTIELPYFEGLLKQKGENLLPPVTAFETGANTWRQFDRWPPADTTGEHIYLADGGVLQTSAPSPDGPRFSEYISDPAQPVPYSASIGTRVQREYMVEDQRFLSGRKDVLSFSTPPLSGDVVVAGPARATLFVSSAGTDADWVVKLIDVFPDSINEQGWGNFPLAGYQMLVRGDVFRGKFRQSYSVPVPFTPNRVTRVSFSLQDVFHRFRRGHRIMVQIQSSWFPLVDRNPQKFLDIYSARPDDFVRATQRVYHTREYPSEIVLPVTHGG